MLIASKFAYIFKTPRLTEAIHPELLVLYGEPL